MKKKIKPISKSTYFDIERILTDAAEESLSGETFRALSRLHKTIYELDMIGICLSNEKGEILIDENEIELKLHDSEGSLLYSVENETLTKFKS